MKTIFVYHLSVSIGHKLESLEAGFSASGFYQAEVQVLGLWSYQKLKWGKFTFDVSQVIGRIHPLAIEGLVFFFLFLTVGLKFLGTTIRNYFAIQISIMISHFI